MAAGTVGGAPWPLLTVWIVAAVGWGAVLGLLRRDGADGTAVFLHAITPATLVLGFAFTGFGSLYSTVFMAVQWWTLVAATRGRPDRILAGGPSALATAVVWLVLTFAAAYAVTRAVL
ncbi:hypothetical protein DZF91_27780 [Actinomadura logoneensis]|uniref:Yip1 domain-containing protein n=1 Tax=Actinomadura logoneensis TaxID=2293572 RepID=A0A372JGF3_9ACTN|nr:hypothetical protein [Actinomadura logoneensis]RFU38428.1 hypothetical protein DZF91_27780 [Actinomadura logoneensis]